MKRLSPLKIGILAAALLLAPSRLMAETRAAYARVWPSDPGQARLAFVQNIYAPADIGIKSSAWSHLAFWLTGTQRNAVRLTRPFGVAVDQDGNLCLTDTGDASVLYFDLRHKSFREWKQIGGIRFQSPVAVAKIQDTFYVADSQLAEVLAFNIPGHLLFTLTNHLSRPVGLAISSAHLFVVDSQLHQVAVFDLNGNYAFQFGRRGLGPGEFNFPTHITAGPRGEILVTDSMNSRVEMFDGEGHFLRTIGDAGNSSGHFSRPKGVAVDNKGHIYVMDGLFDNLQVFDQSGQFLLDIGSTGTGPGEFWLPSGIAISADNEIFIADSYNRRVQVFKYIGP